MWIKIKEDISLNVISMGTISYEFSLKEKNLKVQICKMSSFCFCITNIFVH